MPPPLSVARIGRLAARHLRKLEDLRRERTSESAALKLELLAALSAASFAGRQSSRARLFIRYHDLLLYMAAFPDNGDIHRLALQQLKSFPHRIDERLARAMKSSGIAGTVIEYAFEFPMAAWLRSACPGQVEIDWKECETEALQKLLPLLSGLAEEPGLEDEEISTEDWMRLAAGNRNTLVWLIDRIRELNLSPRLRDHLFDSMELPLVLRLDQPGLSKTSAYAERAHVFHHEAPLQRGVADLRMEIGRPLDRPSAETREEALFLIRVARASLAAREREIYPISHANPSDVMVYALDRGLEIVTYGVLPERRMILEGLWGYLLLKNGIPVGYGCFSCLFESSEIAFNIFDSFRHGEAALTYAALLRVIHHHTGALSFSVMKYQFGHENDEAIKSGAFWFYHKLGFRPFSAKMRAKVEAEAKRLKSRPGSRSDARTLKLFATENLYFHLGEENRAVLGNFRYAKAGMIVTSSIAAHQGDRTDAILSAREHVAGALGGRIPRNELADELCLLLACIPDLAAWPAVEMSEMLRIILTKSGPSERESVLGMNGHASFRRAIMGMVPEVGVEPTQDCS